MRRRLAIALLAAGILVGLLAPTPAAASPALPDSMAALSDSITRAYDVCCSYRDHPGQSWSTGGTWYDGISSHYERIKRRNSAITARAYNDAVTRAKMSGAEVGLGGLRDSALVAPFAYPCMSQVPYFGSR